MGNKAPVNADTKSAAGKQQLALQKSNDKAVQDLKKIAPYAIDAVVAVSNLTPAGKVINLALGAAGIDPATSIDKALGLPPSALDRAKAGAMGLAVGAAVGVASKASSIHAPAKQKPIPRPPPPPPPRVSFGKKK